MLVKHCLKQYNSIQILLALLYQGRSVYIQLLLGENVRMCLIHFEEHHPVFKTLTGSALMLSFGNPLNTYHCKVRAARSIQHVVPSEDLEEALQ
jgi:hypothetical protein